MTYPATKHLGLLSGRGGQTRRLTFVPLLILTLLTLVPGAPGAASDDPVLSWKRGEAPLAAPETRLKQLATGGFSFGIDLLVPPVNTNALVQWQSPDRKAGFRLLTRKNQQVPVLSLEMAFDWNHRRNNRPLELNVPLTVLEAGRPNLVIVRFTGPTLELFVDGVLVDEEWPVGNLALPTGEALTFGTDDALQGFRAWTRPLSREEIAASSGGTNATARRELEIMGVEPRVTQYWKPRGLNTWVGDCMPFFHQGRFRLLYLIDRRGHGSKWGLGAHQWAQVSSADLVHWEHHPLAVPITEQSEGSICTGSAFAHDGVVHAFFAIRTADGSPARLTAARSQDGIHFEKAPWTTTLGAPYSGPPARDPIVFRDPVTNLFHMLVTTELLQPEVARRGGCLAHLVSSDLSAWQQREPYLVPGFADQPECADWFEWNGWYYLIFSNNGVARYRLSRNPHGPWIKPAYGAFDGAQARVLKTAPFHGNRRLGAAFVTQAGSGYAGQLVMREILQHADGTLGTAFPREMQPALGDRVDLGIVPLTTGVTGDVRRVHVQSLVGLSLAACDGLPEDFRLTFRARPAPGTAAFGVTVRGSGRYEAGHELRFEPGREKVVWRNTDADTLKENERAALYAVQGLSDPLMVEVIVKGDLYDVCVDGRHTLIARGAQPLTGQRLFFFAQNGGVTFEDIEVTPLVTEKPASPVTKNPERRNRLRAGNHIQALTHQGSDRNYLVHIPKSYDDTEAYPVVLVFHGGGSNARDWARYCGLNEKADEAEFIAIYPNGTGKEVQGHHVYGWNGGPRQPGGNNPDHQKVDDVGFTRALLDDLAQVCRLDSNRIYATGMSMGAIMVYRLASELSDRIAAIAPIAGPMGTESCRPTRPVPVLHFHGSLDEAAPLNGGQGKLDVSGTDFYSVEHSIRAWIKANGCNEQPLTEQLPDRVDDGTTVTRQTYRGGHAGSEVILITIQGGGHTWPGRHFGPELKVLGRSSEDVVANDVMWEFFERHRMTK